MNNNSAAIQLGTTPNQWNTVDTSGTVTIEQPGYVLFFTGSKVSSPVYWDNVNITWYKGTVLEENHYYPFGLTLNAAPANPRDHNKYLLTTKELQDEHGLNWYDFGARMQDMQIGRWGGIDPLAEQYYSMSGYTFVSNNPPLRVDLNGKSDGHYYDATGKLVGDDHIDDNKVYLETQTLPSAEQTMPGGPKSATAYSELKITQSSLIDKAATVYGESSASMGRTSEIKEEMYSIASVHQRNNPDAVAYGATNAAANAFRARSDEERNGTSMQTAVGAVINAAIGGPDYSNGAQYWDGAEQAQFPSTDTRRSTGKYELHQNTQGWSISDRLYQKWSDAVGSSFQAPQVSFGSYGNNAGYISREATAVWGKTIFWKPARMTW